MYYPASPRAVLLRKISQSSSLLLKYLPVWYCETPSLATRAAIPNTATSFRFASYLQTYSMDSSELQYSTLQCALNVLEHSGVYGTIRLLCRLLSSLFFFFFLLSTLSFCRYSLRGDDDQRVTVYCLRFRQTTFGAFVFDRRTVHESYSSSLLLTILDMDSYSAQMIASISSRFIFSTLRGRICARDSPLFCHSTEYIQHRTSPKTWFLTLMFTSAYEFLLEYSCVLWCRGYRWTIDRPVTAVWFPSILGCKWNWWMKSGRPHWRT